MKNLNLDNRIIKSKKHRLRVRSLHQLFLISLLVTPFYGLFSHGTVTDPPSRVYICFGEITANAGNPVPESPACLASYNAYGGQAFYDWNEVARMDAANNHLAVIPDGNLASAGRPDKYGGLDQTRDDWISEPVEPGPFSITWTNSAPHQTLYYRVYITNADWDPSQPLTWAGLEQLVETGPRPASGTDVIDFVLPERSGKHVLYSIWQRSLSDEAFYSTIDIDFGSRVVEEVAPVADFSFENGLCGGPEVTFSAADSYDLNGDDLTYTWDFGDGNTATGEEVSYTFSGSGSALVSLTVSDGQFSSGATETINLNTDPDCSGLVCAFDAPRESALPSINENFERIFVLGENGPDLESISKFTVNWDGVRLNTFQCDINVFPHYLDFKGSTQNFDQPRPQVTITDTTIAGFDGDYYVTVDDGNFVMASVSGGFTIYLTQDEVAPECDDDVSVITETLRGGTLPDNLKYEFVIGDGTADYATGITVEGAVGDSTQWLITDQSGVILGLPNAPEDFNFDAVDASSINGVERLFVYNLSYNGGITGLSLGSSTISLRGEYELSDAVEIYVSEDASDFEGTNNCTFGTPRATPISAINGPSFNKQMGGSITVFGENGPDLSGWRKLDISYQGDTFNNFYFDELPNATNGTQLKDFITDESFDQVNPEFTFSGTGIENFDGTYYVNYIDVGLGENKEDFVMVSKTGNFSIYFSFSSEAPDCDATLSVDELDANNAVVVKQNFPNPFSGTTNIGYVLKEKSAVSVKVYSLAGQLVQSLSLGEKNVGPHQLTLDLKDLSSGLYMYVFETESATFAKRMILQQK